MIRLEITLSDWFYNSILGKEVLTINRDYFRLAKPLERRLYEIARKHCGYSNSWKIGLDKLKEKTGSTSTLPKFRYFIKQIEMHNHLPDYIIRLTKADVVCFDPRKEFIALDDLPTVNRETIARGKQLSQEAGTGWDFNELHAQFSHQLLKGFKPENVNGAFINFVKKKVATQP